MATNTITQTICAGDSIVVAGTTYNTTGIYTDTLVAANSCDSILTVDLTVNPVASEYDYANDLRGRFNCSSGHDL